MDKPIGKLVRVPLREVWRHEALDLTRWLTDNPDVLGDMLGISLKNVEREHEAGDFSVDMRAEDDDGNVVVIENQLERSNHDHLGKLLTYVAALEAKIGIWIVSDPRPEHIGAINWLNQAGTSAFYLLKIEAVRIGASEPAPLLTLITGPSKESIEIGRVKKEYAERHNERYEFWSALLDASKGRTKLFSTVSPGRYSWIGMGSGKSGITFNYVVWRESAAVELYIDRKDENENERIFRALEKSKGTIEQQFGAALEWDYLEDRRACRIRRTLDLGGYKAPEKWPGVHSAMIDNMIALERALRPEISNLEFS